MLDCIKTNVSTTESCKFGLSAASLVETISVCRFSFEFDGQQGNHAAKWDV